MSGVRRVGNVRILLRSDRATWRLRIFDALNRGQLDRRTALRFGIDSLRAPLCRAAERGFQIASKLIAFEFGIELELDRVVSRTNRDDELDPVLRGFA